ncbi:glycerol-3-phosphate dehydrogenase [Catalinimonas alkaloidigena]|uniref:Glycerol-3-phosphate dehydrogenase n=1 Tax=Catalinimonas alkaloidigena TaxID=1075417 RepID=A0A1G8YJ96_9BACT|nr:glycerol-3-phosphate dehydrogenase/oxidase [Catalinimonas alkaloidigena]SDK02727.1 glycerol-3-phosphate dehydrogenase [Catalinimonas alkaloidigena]
MNSLSAFHRHEVKQRMSSETFDLLVIGGGITGAGIALDAASRGLKVALVEKYDFASGTSSRSTKLIHGGLRYLKQLEIALVREVGRERAIVHRLAPHLVTAEKMLLPLTKDGTYGKLATSVGLFVYDVLAGVEKPDQRVMLSKEEALEKEPLLDPTDLEGGGYYAEYRTDDARLTVEIIKTAARYGVLSLNYMEVVDFEYDAGEVKGAQCRDGLSGDALTIRAHYVVSAAGPWVDQLRDKNHSLSGKRLHLTKGVHLVVPHERFPVKQAVYFDVFDGRMIFAIPRGKITYIGTTDTDYTGDINHVVTKRSDAHYLLRAVNQAFPTVNLTLDDVESSWAGLRPLIHEDGKSASELSRKDEIFESETGLISIAGGKLTGYRKMAERVVDRIFRKEEGQRPFRECLTDQIVLAGGEFADEAAVGAYVRQVEQQITPLGLTSYDAYYLVHNYGRDTDEILDLLKKSPDQPEINLGLAELAFCFEHEMVHRPLDFFERRTGRLYFNITSVPLLLDPVLKEFRQRFGWDDVTYIAQREAVKTALYEASQIFKEESADHY